MVEHLKGEEDCKKDTALLIHDLLPTLSVCWRRDLGLITVNSLLKEGSWDCLEA